MWASPSSAAPDASPGWVTDCRPCVVKVAPDASYRFTFEFEKSDGDRALQAIAVTSEDGTSVQRLPVDGMRAYAPDELFFMHTQDVDFDGNGDVLLLADGGASNAYAHYWRYRPQERRFEALGRYPVFRIEPERRRLFTHETGGHGGRIYDDKEYMFLEGRLTLLRQESQHWDGARGRYMRVVRERRDGRMRETERRWMETP